MLALALERGEERMYTHTHTCAERLLGVHKSPRSINKKEKIMVWE